ncbi:hypothetical protein TNCT_684021 [Trichonephila clavata]|uniref:Uncharacterized protein n=1 Tax=Trichonephila clavata TaxID=2740835 RepID=A0A8X6FHT6_TRICU|nr:hypothetical protein TNCT_684021 [Trichonephila clavata]
MCRGRMSCRSTTSPTRMLMENCPCSELDGRIVVEDILRPFFQNSHQRTVTDSSSGSEGGPGPYLRQTLFDYWLIRRLPGLLPSRVGR